MYVRKWRRMKMYIKKKKHLRSFVLVSATPLKRFCWCSAIVSAWATWTVGALGCSSRAWFTCGGHSGCTTTPVSGISLRKFLQLLFQGVSPVILSCCWRIGCSSLALKMGSRNWSPTGGSYPPLPPRPGCLIVLGMVAHNYCSHVGMILNQTVGFCFNLYS